MSMFDKLRTSARKVAREHGDKIEKGLDKAAHVVDERTKGKYRSQIRKGVSAAKEGLHKVEGDEEPPR